MEPAVYGFVGAGEITAAIVTGLSTEVADPPRVLLSPRGHDIGRALADRFPNVRVCGSNQEVVEYATWVVLAVRPQKARGVLAELTFGPRHVVMSAVAGVSLAQLRDWTAPARHVTRVVPLPQAARGDSMTAIHPDNYAARDLFGRVGDLVVAGDESALDAFSAATATFAAHLDYLDTIASWLAEHGVDQDTATIYTTHIFGQLGRSLSHDTDSLATLTEKHMTPGGLNEQVMTDLRRDGVPDMVRGALDRVLDRLAGDQVMP